MKIWPTRMSLPKTLKIALPVLGLAVAVVVAHRQLGRRERDEKSLREAELQFAATVAAEGVQAGFERFVSDSAVFFDVDPEQLVGRAALEARREAWRSTIGLRWTPVGVHVADSGELGYTWGPSEREVLQPDGSVKVYFGHYVSVWRRDSNHHWRLALDTGNGDPARPPVVRPAAERVP